MPGFQALQIQALISEQHVAAQDKAIGETATAPPGAGVAGEDDALSAVPDLDGADGCSRPAHEPIGDGWLPPPPPRPVLRPTR